MNRRLYSWAIRVLLVGALLPGCATGPRLEKRARRPSESAVGKESSKPGGETGEETLEHRVRAIAHFGAGISAELNDDDGAALEHHLKSAANDRGHEVLVLELHRLLQQKQQDNTTNHLTAKTT